MSAEARFAPGDWYAVVGDHVTVLLPGSQRARVPTLWDLADSGADADAVLDALLAGGLSALDHFALVAHGADTTRLLVRGAPTASVSTADGDEIVSATPGTAWREHVVTGACSIRLTLSGDSAVEHALTPGLARVSVVEFSAPTVSAVAPRPAAPAHRSEEHPMLAVVPDPVPDPVPELAPAPAPEPEPEPEPMSFGEPEGDPAPTGEVPVVEDDWDRDGQTMAGRAQPDFERPPIPGQEIAPDVVSQPVASLVFSTGDVVSVDRTVLVGRAPEARRFASHDQPHVVTVSSPHQEISSTHLEIRPGAGADHGSAIATDLGSTNGTVLAQPGLDPEDLTPGIAVSLIPGAVLDLGDGVTIQVTNP